MKTQTAVKIDDVVDLMRRWSEENNGVCLLTFQSSDDSLRTLRRGYSYRWEGCHSMGVVCTGDPTEFDPSLLERVEAAIQELDGS